MRLIPIFCFFLTAVFFTNRIQAQKGGNDSLLALIHNNRAMVVHQVKDNENLYSIAQTYSVPALVLSQNNDLSFYDKLVPGRSLMIPLGNYNYMQTGNVRVRNVYFKLRNGDTYPLLADLFGVKEQNLRELNNNTELSRLNTILAGWVAYTRDEPETGNVMVTTDHTGRPAPQISSASPLSANDTVKHQPSELELIYNYQTNEGVFLDSLSGMVVFFKPQTTVNNKLLYAFSNDIGKGRVIKVTNPSNQKFVFAKIIGPLPATKQYINAKIGLDGRARAVLETREVKLWCDLYFKY